MVRSARSRNALSFLTISALVSMWACVQPALNRHDPVSESRAELPSHQVQTLAPAPQTGVPGGVLAPVTPPIIRPARVLNLGVRGYITAIGGAARPSGATNPDNNKPQPKEVYLPGVKVHLQDAGTGANSKTAVTDLSGRFTLYAPKVGRYHLCWVSPVYG